MNKIARITWKDLLVTFRDRAALILMIGGPLLLTIGLGLVTGAFSDDNDQILPVIPLLIVNQDTGELGEGLVNLFYSDDVADLVSPETAIDPEAARSQVEAGEYAAAVVIPPGFSDGILPSTQTGQTAEAAPIVVYGDPARPISAGVINTIVNSFVNQVQTGVATVTVSLNQLITSGAISPEQLPIIGEQLGRQTAAGQQTPITINQESLRVGTGTEFNPLAYFAPAMALLFLMYTVTVGARSFLVERQQKTLARMLVSPVTPGQILGGKVLSIFLSGVIQVSVLIGLSAVLFGLRWGNPLGVALLILAAAAAATGWGLLIASVASTPAQISTIGTTVMLSFGILGGSFFAIDQMGPAMQVLSKITPNAWAMDGFSQLSSGGGLADLVIPLTALVAMAIILFALAAILFGRRQTALVTA